MIREFDTVALLHNGVEIAAGLNAVGGYAALGKMDRRSQQALAPKFVRAYIEAQKRSKSERCHGLNGSSEGGHSVGRPKAAG